MEEVVSEELSPVVKQPKIFYKGERVFTHTLYKTDVQNMLKNESWVYGVPRTLEIEHVHMAHSHDRKGKKNKYTAKVGGHFHEIITHDDDGNEYLDDNGFICPKLGHALCEKKKKLKSRKIRTTIEQVSYFHSDDDKWIKDNHTHSLTNLGSEEISPHMIKETQEANKAAIAAMGVTAIKAAPPEVVE